MKYADRRYKDTAHPLLYRGCALVMAMSTAFTPAYASAAAIFPGLTGRIELPRTPDVNQLPTGFSVVGGTGATQSTTGSSMTITQNTEKVIIDWSSFDIGKNASVVFKQGSSSYAVLNRINDIRSSVINGLLQADGKVYLINRNGVFFGPDAKVQLHSLVASSFPMSSTDFFNGIQRFSGDSVSDATVSNEGDITTDNGGSVFFVAPKIQNLGRISAPGGKIDLVALNANGEVEIKEVTEDHGVAYDVLYGSSSSAGDVANMRGGSLIGEDGGVVGLYGNTVRNDGQIRVETTRSKNGVINLVAGDMAATGEGSVTDVDVSGSSEAMGRTALAFTPGVVRFTGLYKKVSDTVSEQSVLKRIDHEGSITAHSGDVVMEATDRVFLGEKSGIDVSGLNIERSMEDQFLTAQLNSIYLRDYYGQKYNPFPKGTNVTVDVLRGSNIGDLSPYYLGMQKNARDLSTAGGTITIGAPNKYLPDSHDQKYTLNDIVISKGANLNISGGTTTYSGKGVTTSMLVTADGYVYDIASAPQWLTYTGVAGQTPVSYGRYGTTVMEGISFGGHLIPLSSIATKLDDRVVGGDGGTVALKARVVAGLTDSAITGGVTRGRYQTATTTFTAEDKAGNTEAYQKYLISLNRGLEEAKGAKLIIGNSLTNDLSSEASVKQDAAVTRVEVSKSVASVTPGSLTWDGELLASDGVTRISSDMINRAGLGTLEINANTSIKTNEGAAISLSAGGAYTARARRIEFLGSIATPGGTVEMMTRPNITSFEYLVTPGDNPLYDGSIRETIYLGANSAISTAGEKVDYSSTPLAANQVRSAAHIDGGAISLVNISESGVSGATLTRDNQASVVISDGAQLDVSGGHLIGASGTVSGGNAGSLTVKAPTISLGGELRGYSLAGKNGGSVTLHAQEVVVASAGKRFQSGFGIDDLIPADQVGKLTLAADRFKETGFTRISLSATDNLTVQSGVTLAPSLVKSAPPNKLTLAGATCSGGTCTLGTDYIAFTDQIGATSVSLAAGKNIYDSGFYNSKLIKSGNNDSALLSLADGSGLVTAPGGAITLNGPNVQIGGTLDSAAGTVTATATSGDLALTSNARILAAGYNKQTLASATGLPASVPTPIAGGTVNLKAAQTLRLSKGALVDVSGSKVVEADVVSGNGTSKVRVAGDAGKLTLTYGTSLDLQGKISGGVNIAGATAGDLTVKNTAGDLTLDSTALALFKTSGFDALTFVSPTRIILPAADSFSVGRSLTLDSKLIEGTGSTGDRVLVNAPWIRLINNGDYTADSVGGTKNGTGGSVSFLADNLDVEGSLALNGFSSVNLLARKDLTFKDYYYTNSAAWKGELKTDAAALALQGSRIYPTTASKFEVSDLGKVTILPGAVDNSTIYSAGGSLAISAQEGIDHQGYLAAPLGSITLDGGAGRVELASTSVTTTSGAGSVAYGTYDGSTWWDKYQSDTNTGSEVTGAPKKAITLKGNEVVVRDGAVQDLSGGGEVYATYFQPGLAGTSNPLTVSGRYVILPAGGGAYTGTSVYLEACPSVGLAAGFYTILPASYAFVPGALVIQTTGTQLLAGQKTTSKEHYPVVAGYLTKNAGGVARQVMSGFSVRLASDVLKEGDFTFKRFTAGDGGNLSLLAGNGAYFGGTVRISPLAGYLAGGLDFSAKHVTVSNGVAAFDPNGALGDTLNLDAATLSNLAAGEVKLGSAATDSITVSDDTSLKAGKVTLTAGSQVTVGKNAQVEATGIATGDYVSVVSGGGFSMADKAAFTSQKGIELNVNTYDIAAGATLNSGASGYFSFSADRLVFDDTSKTFWSTVFANNGNLKLAGTSGIDLAFNTADKAKADVTLANSGSLTIDTPLVSAATDSKGVTFQSGTINLLNSGSASSAAVAAGDGSVTFKATAITVTQAKDGATSAVGFNGVKSLTLDSANDLVFKGATSLTTPGDLTLAAARVTTAGYRDGAAGTYTAADVTIDARNGAVTLSGSQQDGGKAGTAAVPGGTMQILGDTITQTGGTIEVAGGQIGLAANRDISINGSITATVSALTAADGTVYTFGAGKITLQSDGGKVQLNKNATLDVSAVAGGGDAGSIVLSAVMGGVVKDGSATLLGKAGTGRGGSFSIDSASLDGVGGLNGVSSVLAKDGFNETLNIRSRSGDLVLSSTAHTLTGCEVSIAADGGSITINGATTVDPVSKSVSVTGGINADTTDGSGRIELYAGKNLNLEAGATLSAKGTNSGANGGTVILSSQDGSGNSEVTNSKVFDGAYALNVKSGSIIDVSGNGGTGGTVALRAYQGRNKATDTALNDVNIGAIDGAITGASRVSVEAVRAYTGKTLVGELKPYTDDTAAFMAAATTAKTKNRFSATHFQAGIEISSAAGTDLTVDQALNFSTVRPGGEPVVLTLKSGGNLLVNQSITDAPTSIDQLYSKATAASATANATTGMQDSTAINLVAGSDGGANYLGTLQGSALAKDASGAASPLLGSGDLKIANNKWVYTENAAINFAAGNDVTFGSGAAPGTMINTDMKYNLGSYGGTIRGAVGRDFNLTTSGSAVQTALGNIVISTGRDLNLGTGVNNGAIRTTGEYNNSGLTAKMPGLPVDTRTDRTSYWTYGGGGNIAVNVAGALNGNLVSNNGWDAVYTDKSATISQKAANPWYLTAGYGGSGQAVTAGIATMAGGNISVRSGKALKTQIGTFGAGNLSVISGGDMIGRFRVMNGAATLTSAGGFGTSGDPTVLELANSRTHVLAMGDVHLGSVQNPDNTRDKIFPTSSKTKWNLTYSPVSSFSADSLAGSLTLYGKNPYSNYSMTSSSSVTSLVSRKRILPATFALSAAGDITIRDQFVLAPSANGNLKLVAGGDVLGISADGLTIPGFIMQDVYINGDAEKGITPMYGLQADSGAEHYGMLTGDIHYGINHANDNVPVVVTAGSDIRNLMLKLNKTAQVTALKGDISELYFTGQNTNSASLTSIVAGGNIDQGVMPSYTDVSARPVITVGGPGTLLVQAGENISLGNSGGINSVGNQYNSSFSGSGTATDSDLIIVAGARKDASLDKTDIAAFFEELKTASDELSALKNEGKTDEEAAKLEQTEKVIAKYFGTYDKLHDGASGNLTLTDSAISSRSGSIYTMVFGNIDVGKTAIGNTPKASSGITTIYGGSLNLYAGNDVNVNESRLMTFLGGDITVWSDQGDINAGRGSKTVVSAPSSYYTFDDNGVLTSVRYTPPAAGSGIRALTFDPDGNGPIAPPDAGDVHIYAKGTLDAGEAGIQGKNIYVTANAVLNSINFVFSGASVGVPSSSGDSVNIGAMSGTSDITSDKNMIETIANSIAAADKKSTLAQSDDFIMKYLDVKILDLSNEQL